MEFSADLPDDDIRLVDKQRSTALHRAAALLHDSRLSDQYAEAFREWEESPDGQLWNAATGDAA